MNRLRRYLLPGLLVLLIAMLCGKPLVWPTKTIWTQTTVLPGGTATIGHPATELGWPWRFSEQLDTAPFPAPRNSSIFFSGWLLIADCAVLLTVLVLAWIFTSWLWRRTGCRFQFSLRGLLLFTVCLGLPLGWIMGQINGWRQEQQAISDLANENVIVHQNDYVYSAPEWLRRLIGNQQVFRRVSAIHLDWTTDQRPYGPVLESALHRLPFVRTLEIVDCPFRVKDPSAYANIQDLEIGKLSLYVTGDDDSVNQLAAFPNLRSLKVAGNWFTDAGLAQVAHCRNLERLAIQFSRATDNGVCRLTGLRHLQSFGLSGSSTTGSFLTCLATLPELRSLNLSTTDVTDNRIAVLATMNSLEELDIRNCSKLTDQGVRGLVECPNLKSVLLPTTISNETRQFLRNRIAEVQ